MKLQQYVSQRCRICRSSMDYATDIDYDIDAGIDIGIDIDVVVDIDNHIYKEIRNKSMSYDLNDKIQNKQGGTNTFVDCFKGGYYITVEHVINHKCETHPPKDIQKSFMRCLI